MARTNTQTSKTSAPAPATKDSKKTTSTPAAKKASAPEPAPTPAPASEPEPVPETADNTASDSLQSIEFTFNEFSSKLTEFISLGQTLKKMHIALEKRCTREIKNMQKICAKKNKNKNNSRKQSGFSKPVPISDEMASFLGKSSGTLMSRTNVTKELTGIFREKKMQDKTNGRRIIPTPELKKLLRLGPNDELTYFNLQRYVSPHFPKSASSSTATASA